MKFLRFNYDVAVFPREEEKSNKRWETVQNRTKINI